MRIEDEEGCPRYIARSIRGVRLRPAPLAARQRLFLLGVRPINNVVDATNYAMLEIGTPLHAFDLARIQQGEVRIRRAATGERLVTLDGKERVLQEQGWIK